MNGAATNPDCHVLAYAGAQLKKGLDTAQKLGAQNFGTSDLIVSLSNVYILLFLCNSVATLYLSPQCFGEEGKASLPSTILMLLLN